MQRLSIIMPNGADINLFDEDDLINCLIISVDGILDILNMVGLFKSLNDASGLMIDEYEWETANEKDLQIIINVLNKKYIKHPYPIVNKFARELREMCKMAIERNVPVYFNL